MKNFRTTFALSLVTLLTTTVRAHDHPDVHLHVNPRWKECSFQLDPSLTQSAWKQFTREAGLVTYFRPLTDARPMGRGKVELSLLKWQSGIDETKDAWNNTFVHPDSTHWLVDGPHLAFPGLSLRTGLNRKMDLGLYWTQSPGANYGFYGAQLQYNLVNDSIYNWALSTRASYVSIYGPPDVAFNNAGFDLLASKTIRFRYNWLSVSPYAYASVCFAHGHEKSNVVNLKDENVFGFQGAVGASANISIVRLGIEYNMARINTLSYKIGIGYNFGSGKKRR